MTTGEGWPAGTFIQHPAQEETSHLPENLIGQRSEVEVTVNGRTCRTLLDTGSDISTISQSFFETLDDVKLEPLGDLLQVECASGQTMPYNGYVVLNVHIPELGSITEDCLFLVTENTNFNSQVPILLGTNILHNLMNKCVEYHGVRYMQSKMVSSNWKTCFRCITLCDQQLKKKNGKLGVLKSANRNAVSIPSNTSAIIECFVDKEMAFYQPCLAVLQSLQGNTSLAGMEVTPTLIDYVPKETTTIQVHVSNLSLATLWLQPHATVCEIQQCTVENADDSIRGQETTGPMENRHDFLALFNDVSNLDLNSEEVEQIKNFLWSWRKVFSQHEDDVGFTNLVSHKIQLHDDTPFKQRYRKIPPSMYDEVKQHLQHLLNANIIRKSYSPFSSNVVLVRRKDGRLRLCVDYRFLNNRTVKDAYALPRIDDLLEGLSGSKYFTVLDLKSAYMQVAIHEDHKERTAFTVGPLGFYEFQRMPFGLCNSPATYQRLMDECLVDLNHQICHVYLDDVIITGPTFEEHLKRISAVLQRLQDCGMKVAPKKCQIFKTSVKYVGHVVSSDGITADPAKVNKILEWPTPQNVKQLRSFLGFAGYYRRYIQNYSKISRPLNDLLGGPDNQQKHKKGRSANKVSQTWTWGIEQENAFSTLKTSLTTPPVLSYPDYSKSFSLHVDACPDGLGAVIYQNLDGKDRVIAYGSRSLTKTERNYSTYKLEFLALKWAITQRFNDYLYGSEFVVYTDHNPLTYLLTTARLDATGHRWLSALSMYNFAIKFKSGCSHKDADAMSRLPSLMQNEHETEEITQQSVKAICDSLICNNGYYETICMTTACEFDLHGANLNYRDWRTAQNEDPALNLIRKFVSSGIKPCSNHALLSPWMREINKICIKRGILYRRTEDSDGKEKFQLLLPSKWRQKSLQCVHDDVGHLGRDRAMTLLRDRFFWPGMGLELAKHISNCGRCLRRKACVKVRAPMEPIETTQPLELVCMDYLTLEASKGGFKYILVITDHFTKYALAIPTKDMTAKTTAEAFFNSFVVHYGLPHRIHTDQGANFEGKLIKDLCKMMGVEKSRTTPFHPQGNGCCERFNRTLLNMLGTLEPIDKADWKSHIGNLVFAYNCTRHDTTGFAPYFLLFGRNPRLPVDVIFGLIDPEENRSYSNYVQHLKERLNDSFKLASTAARQAQNKQKKYYDLRARAAVLDVGDRVLVKATYFEGKHKLADKWENEPYVIVKQPNQNIPVYELEREDGNGRVRILHRNMLLPLNSILIPLEDPCIVPSNEQADPSIQNSELSETEEDNVVITVATQDKAEAEEVSESLSSEGTSSSDESLNDNDDSPETENSESVKVDLAPNVDISQPGQKGVEQENTQHNEPGEESAPRRSTRNKKKPQWMESGEYITYSSSSSNKPVPAPRKSRNNTNKENWTIKDRIHLLRLLSSEGVFNNIPTTISESIWQSIVGQP